MYVRVFANVCGVFLFVCFLWSVALNESLGSQPWYRLVRLGRKEGLDVPVVWILLDMKKKAQF